MNNIQFNVEALQGGAVNNLISQILDLVYPVGSLYYSKNNTDPSTLFGGTWKQIKDVFILAAGDVYTVEQTGGEATHFLTVREIPTHSHSFGVSTYVPKLLSEVVDVHVEDRAGSTYRVPGTSSRGPGWNDITNTAREGGGLPHNNMPPYITYYCFERIA